MFIGASFEECGSADKQVEQAVNNNLKAIGYATARWDSTNGMMAVQPSLRNVAVRKIGPEKMARANDLRDKFTLSWLWKQQLEGRGFSAHARFSGIYRVGRMLLRLHFVFFVAMEHANRSHICWRARCWTSAE